MLDIFTTAPVTLASGAEIPIIIGLAIATSATSSGISAYAARKQNDAIAKAAEAQLQGTKVQQKQLQEAAALEKLKRQRDAHAIQGRLRRGRDRLWRHLRGPVPPGRLRPCPQRADHRHEPDQPTRAGRVRLPGQCRPARIPDPQPSALGGLSGFSTGLSIGVRLKSLAARAQRQHDVRSGGAPGATGHSISAIGVVVNGSASMLKRDSAGLDEF